MNKKISLLIITVFLTVIVFGFSIHLQRKLVNYIPTIKCVIVNKDIEAFQQIMENDIKYVDMPISIISSTKVIQEYSKIKSLYLKDKIYAGQLVLPNQLDTRENLMIYQADVGKEKIAIKIKSAENGVAFTIRENSIVNVYATMRKEYMENSFSDIELDSIGSEEDGYSIIKILDSVKVLGTFNSDGESLNESLEKNIDTILVSVTQEEANKINLIRDVAVFNITELGTVNVEEDFEEKNLMNNSGDNSI